MGVVESRVFADCLPVITGRSQLHGDGSGLSAPEPTGQAQMAVHGTTRLLTAEGPSGLQPWLQEEQRARDQIHREEAIGQIQHRGPCVCDRSEVGEYSRL